MKIAIATNFLYPEGLGGTELYCYRLLEALHAKGHEVFWFVPNFNTHITSEESFPTGVGIVRFAAVEEGKKPNADFVSFSFINELLKRDICVIHFNEFGGFEGISYHLIDAAKSVGIKTVVTLHLPHYVCATGTLRIGGFTRCDGKIIPNRCGSCNIFSNATSFSAFNLFLTKRFESIFNIVDKTHLPVIPKVRKMMLGFKNRLPFLNSLQENADVIVSLTKWFRDVLVVNGISKEKIQLITQASPNLNVEIDERIHRKNFVFIGRINKEKGIHLLLEAAMLLKAKMPDVKIELYGPVPQNNPYADRFLQKILNHPNIIYKGILQPKEVMPIMLQYKGVILPSTFTEMAPLIIMEANKVKVPIIVSDVPGSAELVKEYNSGVIFKYQSSTDLVEKMKMVNDAIPELTFEQPFENDFNFVADKYLQVYA